MRLDAAWDLLIWKPAVLVEMRDQVGRAAVLHIGLRMLFHYSRTYNDDEGPELCQ